MSTISKHISQLLHSHDCVITPLLGGFVANEREAFIDHERGIFNPPAKEIGFNRSLQHNDGLLINHISLSEKISYNEAKIKVEVFAKQALKEASTRQGFVIEQVGVLKTDTLNNLQFIADKGENYLDDSFGLSTFHFAPAAPQIHSQNKHSGNIRRLLKPITHRQIAATIGLLIGLFILAPETGTDFNTATYENAGISSLLINEQTNSRKEETSTLLVDTKKLQAIAVTTEEKLTNKNTHFLIAGSFKNRSQAELFVTQLHAKGETEAFVLPSANNNRYRAAINGFSNRSSAINSLNQYRKHTDFSSVWVLTQK